MSHYATDEAPEPYSVRLRRTVLLLLSLCTAVALIRYGQAHPSQFHSHPGCKAEDEVPVYVAHDSYDLHTGLAQCVHIDAIRDPR